MYSTITLLRRRCKSRVTASKKLSDTLLHTTHQAKPDSTSTWRFRQQERLRVQSSKARRQRPSREERQPMHRLHMAHQPTPWLANKAARHWHWDRSDLPPTMPVPHRGKRTTHKESPRAPQSSEPTLRGVQRRCTMSIDQQAVGGHALQRLVEEPT